MHRPSLVRLDSLEALRGIAALIVVLHHACGTMGLAKNYGWRPLADIFEPGQFGVDIFFVLSGFIIYYTNPASGLDWQGIRKFYLRRFFRIYPTYWLICLFVIPLVYLTPGSGEPGLSRDIPTALHSLLLIPYKTFPILGPAWSLCYEVMFYAVFALVLVNRRVGWLVWIGWAGLCLALKVAGVAPGHYYLQQVLSELVALFLMGMVAAWLIRRRGATSAYPAWIAAGLAVIAVHWYFEWIYGREAMVWRHQIYGLGSLALVYGLACRDLLQSPRIAQFWTLIGLYSYSIYLVHRPIQQILVKLAVRLFGHELSPAAALVVLAVVVSISVGAGVLLGRYFEQPSLRLAKRLTQEGFRALVPSRRPRIAAAAAAR